MRSNDDSRSSGAEHLTRTSRIRLAHAGAAMALVALAALAFPPPTAAQSPTTFVSNTNQPFYRDSQIERDRAQRFTTGSHENGYDLSGVRLMFGPGYLFLSVSVCMTDTRCQGGEDLVIDGKVDGTIDLRPHDLNRAGDGRPLSAI